MSYGGGQILEKFEDSLSFKSMRVELSEKERENIKIYDDVLATILNKDGLIRIEDYLIQINSSIDSLVVYNAGSSEEIMRLSVADDFFGIINGEDDSKNNFSEPALGYTDKMTYEFTGLPESLNTSVKCTLVYQKAGVYFSILIKMKEPNHMGRSQLDKKIFIKPGYYTPRKRNTTTVSEGQDVATHCTYKNRLYSGTRRLSKFYIDVIYNVRYDYNLEIPYDESIKLHIRK